MFFSFKNFTGKTIQENYIKSGELRVKNEVTVSPSAISNNKVVIITGTTATGKTKLSIELAKRFNGEIVSADSMQIYKMMDIGTAKPTMVERQGISHHMMDIIMPNENFTLADYLVGADKAVKDILSRGKLPIIVGGTGLYISSFVNNITLCEAETDTEYREYLKKLDGQTLKSMLEEVDPERAAELHQNDIKRLSRALELYKLTSLTAKQQNEASRKNKSPYEFLSFCLTYDDRDILYESINSRVDQMFSLGLENEVRNLLENGYLPKDSTAAQAIGYKEFLPYFSGEITIDTVKESIKQESRRYAKRQLTWFRRQEFLKWVSVDKYDTKCFELLLNIFSKDVEFFIKI